MYLKLMGLSGMGTGFLPIAVTVAVQDDIVEGIGVGCIAYMINSQALWQGSFECSTCLKFAVHLGITQ